MGSSLLYISIAYYMQKRGGWVQIACKIAYILNGRSPIENLVRILLMLGDFILVDHKSPQHARPCNQRPYIIETMHSYTLPMYSLSGLHLSLLTGGTAVCGHS